MGACLGSRQRSFPAGWEEGLQRACYPAHLKRALEPAVLGCVKCGNFPPLMSNLELTANKMGFCLYILVLFLCLTFACRGKWSWEVFIMARICSVCILIWLRQTMSPRSKSMPFQMPQMSQMTKSLWAQGYQSARCGHCPQRTLRG